MGQILALEMVGKRESRKLVLSACLDDEDDEKLQRKLHIHLYIFRWHLFHFHILQIWPNIKNVKQKKKNSEISPCRNRALLVVNFSLWEKISKGEPCSQLKYVYLLQLSSLILSKQLWLLSFLLLHSALPLVSALVLKLRKNKIQK